MSFSIKSRWIKIAGAVIVVALAIAGIVIATHWPFTRASVIEGLEQTFASTVEVKGFRATYFPAGCVMEGVTLRRNADGDCYRGQGDHTGELPGIFHFSEAHSADQGRGLADVGVAAERAGGESGDA